MAPEKIVQQIAVMGVPLLFSVTFHEVAHGMVAYKLGDPTAKYAGRLTLNPLKHLDLLGLLVFVITRLIGWAKPVPVNPQNFESPRKGMMWVAMAGPGANFLLAGIFAVLFRGMSRLDPRFTSYMIYFLKEESIPPLNGVYMFLVPIYLILGVGVVINVALGIFNLIPIPPLDGGRIVTGILPARMASKYASIEPYGLLIIVILIIFDVFNYVIAPIIWKVSGFLLG